MARRTKYVLALSTTLPVFLVLWIVLAPEHWMGRINWAVVEIDGRPVHADVYIGNPTDNEAEAFALVHVHAEGDYLLNFEDETYREASTHEFLRFYRGAWTYHSMSSGRFVPTLAFIHLNEFRIPSRGRTIIVQF
jgi:hypothetical protein